MKPNFTLSTRVTFKRRYWLNHQYQILGERFIRKSRGVVKKRKSQILKTFFRLAMMPENSLRAIFYELFHVSELTIANNFKRRRNCFCTANDDNFKDMLFKNVRHMDRVSSFKYLDSRALSKFLYGSENWFDCSVNMETVPISRDMSVITYSSIIIHFYSK